MGKYKIELDTLSKAKAFQTLAEKCSYDVRIMSSDGFVGNAKSLLNVMASLEWGDLYVYSDAVNCYMDFQQFILEN